MGTELNCLLLVFNVAAILTVFNTYTKVCKIWDRLNEMDYKLTDLNTKLDDLKTNSAQ